MICSAGKGDCMNVQKLKFVKLILTVLLCAAMLWGCGKEEDKTPTTLGETTPSTSQSDTEVPVDTTAVSAPADPTEPATEPATNPTEAVTEPVTNPTEESIAQTTAPSTEPTTATTIPEKEPPMTSAPVVSGEPKDSDFDRVAEYIPDVVIDLKYATDDNPCGKAIYHFKDAYLRYGTVKKLAAVQRELAAMGYALKIWDAYRPVTAQDEIWKVCKDTTYVTNPRRGYSIHCMGNNVDVTIISADGGELVMPSDFDVFSVIGDRDYSDCSAEAAKNAQFLEDIMLKHGFKSHAQEWWQYSDVDDYEIEVEFLCG
jgi:D-alanyl-D-alanine dipeptidase